MSEILPDPTQSLIDTCGHDTVWNYREGWPTNGHQDHDPPYKAYKASVSTTRFGRRTQVNEEDLCDGQQRLNHEHGPARASSRERRSQSDTDTVE
ncbi:hypothetical protein RvY_00347 [Ramazzottius varieornatus]|uniref:Uncharacterized protein n=1 Tax=Ramazzottius varieornatus TaxID=947166 RepID=A0A1D1UGK2_RAMVA|nr:hypothetical protein RvY_00347 [Ramazzottius varieornatus]